MSQFKQTPRSRLKQKPSRIQEARVIKIIFVLLVLALLWIIFAPGSGVVSLLGKQSELKKLQQETAQIQRQIDALENDIKRLHNDPSYLEDIARKKHNLLKKNEQIYDFSRQRPEKKK